MELEEGDVVLCAVDRIEKTVVSVRIIDVGKGLEGSIITSEIAPGRIRNIRNYVVPNKIIVCKILRISGDRIDLSLRRVSQKEKKEVLDHHNQEKSYISILKSILGDKAEKIIKDIQKKERLYDFIEEAKEDSKNIKKIIGETDAKKILDIIKKQKQKKAAIKKEFYLKSTNPNGLSLIKEILGNIKDAEIKYISAGKYTIRAESTDIKKTDQHIKRILEEISEKIKKLGMEFSVKEK